MMVRCESFFNFFETIQIDHHNVAAEHNNNTQHDADADDGVKAKAKQLLDDF